MEGIKKLLAHRIRDLRKARNMTQEKLAESTGLTTTHIGHIETGRRWASAKVIDRIAAVLGGPEAILPGEASAPLLTAPTPAQALEILTQFVKEKGMGKDNPEHRQDELDAKDNLIQSLQAQLAALRSQQEWAARLARCFPKDQRDIQERIRRCESVAISAQTNAPQSKSSTQKAGGKPPGTAE